MCAAEGMEKPEGAEAQVKREAEGEADREQRQPTMAELLCLLITIQTEMRDRSFGLEDRMNRMEAAARGAYDEVIRLGNLVDGPQQGQGDGMAGGKTTPASTSPTGTPRVTTPPPAAATSHLATSQPGATGFTTSTPIASHRVPPAAPSTQRRRPKPQEFTGHVSLEAYMAQFEMLARAQGWDDGEKAIQLAASLKGPAVEVLGQLEEAQRLSYSALVDALERRYGHKHQEEAYRSRFRTRVRGKGETLQELAQDLEHLVRKAYPQTPEGTTTILLRDQFVDALLDHRLQVYVKQAHVDNLQTALARALEFESFGTPSVAVTRRDAGTEHQSRRTRTRGSDKERGGAFGGSCWTCGEAGHKQRRCPVVAARPARSRSAERSRQGAQRPCCWECGQPGHLARSCPASGTTRYQGNGAGLGQRGSGQPGPGRPHSR